MDVDVEGYNGCDDDTELEDARVVAGPGVKEDDGVSGS